MPSAIKAGLTYKQAMHMTPKAIEMHIKAYTEREQEKIKVSEYLSWLNGYYVVEAIACTFGKGKYPKNPLLEEKESENENGEMPKSELQKQRELFAARLFATFANGEINNAEKEDSE